MFVRFDVTVATSPVAAGLLEDLPVGDHTVYIDLSKVNFAEDGKAGGAISSASNQYLTNGTVDGNVTFNTIILTHQKITNF